MNSQRLKFAQARGARFEMKNAYGSWTAMWYRFDGRDEEYRIRPEDERLLYGPLSTVMLEWAQAPVFTTVSATASTEWHATRHFWLAARFPTDFDGGAPSDYSMTETECRMLALFMAEAMADEGL